MQVPASDPTQKMTLRVGEMDQAVAGGAVWFEHEAHFDPEGPGRLGLTHPAPAAATSASCRRPTGTAPAWEAYYKNTKWNQISTNETFGLPAPLGCCVTNGATKFTMDLFWSQSIRNDMYCRDDDDFCYISFPGRPGWEFHKSVYLKGHFPRTDAVTFAEQAPTNPPTTSASYTFTWASGTTMPGPNEAETSAWMAESNPVLTTADGNKYRVYLGVDPESANAYEPGDPVYWASTTIGLGADSSNGVSRWRRDLGSAWLGSCGVDQPKPAILSQLQGDSWVLQCRLTGNMSILPSNHVQVSWKLEAFRVDTRPGRGPGRPLGHAVDGHEGVRPERLRRHRRPRRGDRQRPGRQPVQLSSAFSAGDITTQHQRKVWYFGDGSVFEGGEGTLPSVPTTHTYAHPGTYPATLVYYAFDPARSSGRSSTRSRNGSSWRPEHGALAGGLGRSDRREPVRPTGRRGAALGGDEGPAVPSSAMSDPSPERPVPHAADDAAAAPISVTDAVGDDRRRRAVVEATAVGDHEITDSLPEDLNVSEYVGPYVFPNNNRRRVPGYLYLGLAVALAVLYFVTKSSTPVLINAGMLWAALGLALIGAYHLLSGFDLDVDEQDALVGGHEAGGVPRRPRLGPARVAWPAQPADVADPALLGGEPAGDPRAGARRRGRRRDHRLVHRAQPRGLVGPRRHARVGEPRPTA